MSASELDRLKALGSEIKMRRLARGIKTLRQFKELTGLSTQYLSLIENAYSHRSRGYVIPSDDALERISKATDMPVSRMHSILGRMPDHPLPVSASAAEIAENFDRLPDYAQQIVQDSMRTAKAVAERVEQKRASETRKAQSGK